MAERASLCVSCHESIRSNTFVRVLAIVFLCLTPIWFLIVALGSQSLLYTLMVLASAALMLFLALPRSGILIKQLTHSKRWLRFPIYLLCFVLAAFLSISPIFLDAQRDAQVPTANETKNDGESFNDSAIKAAKTVLQNNLKNPSSLQIHSADVKLKSIDDNHNPTYVVTLDYSAQNGFGGMNRDTYVVTLVYKIEEGKFYCGNVKINID